MTAGYKRHVEVRRSPSHRKCRKFDQTASVNLHRESTSKSEVYLNLEKKEFVRRPPGLTHACIHCRTKLKSSPNSPELLKQSRHRAAGLRAARGSQKNVQLFLRKTMRIDLMSEIHDHVENVGNVQLNMYPLKNQAARRIRRPQATPGHRTGAANTRAKK